MAQTTKYSLEEAIKAQRSLREAADPGPEKFPVQAFVGIICDEIELQRKASETD